MLPTLARLREKKMLSAGDASSLSATVLNLSIGTDPLLSGPSEQAECLSSCFEVVAQPTSVSRGLTRGLESGDMEIAEANEESHSLFPDLELTDKETWQALNAVLARLDEFQAKEDIPRDQVTGPQIYKMMLVLTAHHGWCVSFSDVSREFLHTSIKDPVFDVPPEEYQSQISEGVGSMLQLERKIAVFSLAMHSHDHDNI